MFDNDEGVAFFPACRRRANATDCHSVDCARPEGFCHDCCARPSQFPPGLHAHACFPGRRQPVPFLAFSSLPHFLGAAEPVGRTVAGLRPRADLHSAGLFSVHATSGSTLSAVFRNQFSVGLVRSDNIT